MVFVFTSVHKLFQFAALLNIRDDYPNFAPITHEGVKQIDEAEVAKNEPIVTSEKVKDLKIMAVTWNMGGTDADLFQTQLTTFFPNVQDYDMVFLASQECL